MMRFPVHKFVIVMDTLSPEKRSQIMGLVRSKNTRPEIAVRQVVHRLGYRFRLHRKDLPGKPDLVLPKWKTVIFVHGCFWHRHPDCPNTRTPKTNVEFWRAKFEDNVRRDRTSQELLKNAGWNVLIVWECEVKDIGRLGIKIKRFMDEV